MREGEEGKALERVEKERCEAGRRRERAEKG